MSGFAGIVRMNGAANAGPPDAKCLERMAAELAFRGPDGANSWERGRASFRFTLLRTGPAPQAETQPCTLDGQTWFLGEVRLDGREELIRRLKGAGELCTSSAADEELILRAWRVRKKFGDDAIFQDLLLGDFSFALWEPEKSQLHCLRSFMGARTFFYCHSPGAFSFSNTLEAVRRAPGVSSELDLRFLGDYLLNSWCLDPERTVYRVIRRLPPGHALTVSTEGLHLRRVTKLPLEEPLWRKRPEEYVEEYRALLHEAVRDRLPRDSAAVFLSGGLDSSTIAATAAGILKESNTNTALYAHTVDYQPLFDDREGEFAAQVARHLGIPIELLHGGDCVPFSGWETLGFPLPEPRHEPFYALQVQQYRMAAAQARVAFSGDGGDDVLMGSAWPYLKYLLRRKRVGTLIKSFGGYFLRYGRIPPLRAGIRSRVRKWLGQQETPPEYPKWLAEDFERTNGLRERWRELQALPKEGHPLHPRAYADLSGSVTPNLQEAEDAAWSGVAMETRAPMLDLRILRFLLRVPPVPWCSDKELLRRAAQGILPEQIRRRPKSPLIEDPLDAHVVRRKWSPLPAAPPSEAVQVLVDWKKWSATPMHTPGLSLWSNLRPLSLDLWWKGVEMRERIQ
jgi:asparagine synthase (glutamine-hydrolysing)